VKPDSAFIEANGIRLHYLAWGDADAAPILLLHPTGFLARTWQPVAELLAARYRVVAPDARGHGDSDKPDASYDWHNIVDDFTSLVDQIGLHHIPVVGHSMGGGVAAFIAANQPDRFSRLVLIEPIILPTDYTGERGDSNPMSEAARKRRLVWDSVDQIIESYRTRPAFERWIPYALRIYAEHGTFRREDGHVELKCPGVIEAQVFDNSSSLNTWDLLGRIDAPALVIRGAITESPVGPLAERVADRLPNARLLSIEDAGHMVPMERPDVIAREIMSFVAQPPA
jgi:lipase